jgi:hypothetical protein
MRAATAEQIVAGLDGADVSTPDAEPGAQPGPESGTVLAATARAGTEPVR